MDNFDLIGSLRTYAAAKNWKFLSGANYFQNYEGSQLAYKNGDIVLTADFNAKPSYNYTNKLSSILYSGVLAMGIKFDDDGTNEVEDDPETLLIDETVKSNDGTPSSLDETFIQKYDRRLKVLTQLLASTITEIACMNGLTINSADIRLELNKFDENIDFVACVITFEQ